MPREIIKNNLTSNIVAPFNIAGQMAEKGNPELQGYMLGLLDVALSRLPVEGTEEGKARDDLTINTLYAFYGNQPEALHEAAVTIGLELTEESMITDRENLRRTIEAMVGLGSAALGSFETELRDLASGNVLTPNEMALLGEVTSAGLREYLDTFGGHFDEIGDRVLDLGASRDVRFARDMREDGRSVVVISSSMVNFDCDEDGNQHGMLLRAHSSKLSVKPESLTGVVSRNAFPWYATEHGLVAGVKEIHNSLEPGGVGLMSSLNGPVYSLGRLPITDEKIIRLGLGGIASLEEYIPVEASGTDAEGEPIQREKLLVVRK